MNDKTISKLAKEAGINVETIRFYERIGILKRPPAPATGWRRYNHQALATIRYIKIGKQMGFTLAELDGLQTKIVGGQQHFCGAVRTATLLKIKSVEEQIENLQRTHRNLQEFLGVCAAKKGTEPCPIYNTLTASAIPYEKDHNP